MVLNLFWFDYLWIYLNVGRLSRPTHLPNIWRLSMISSRPGFLMNHSWSMSLRLHTRPNSRSQASGFVQCPAVSARHQWNLRKHFADRHPMHLVNIPGCLPRCHRCGMQTSYLAMNRGHLTTDLCDNLKVKAPTRR